MCANDETASCASSRPYVRLDQPLWSALALSRQPSQLEVGEPGVAVKWQPISAQRSGLCPSARSLSLPLSASHSLPCPADRCKITNASSSGGGHCCRVSLWQELSEEQRAAGRAEPVQMRAAAQQEVASNSQLAADDDDDCHYCHWPSGHLMRRHECRRQACWCRLAPRRAGTANGTLWQVGLAARLLFNSFGFH